jgi:hypothetical protein
LKSKASPKRSLQRLVAKTADSGLLSPEFAAGMRRVKGAKRLGLRLGNWITAEEARLLWQIPKTEIGIEPEKSISAQ